MICLGTIYSKNRVKELPDYVCNSHNLDDLDFATLPEHEVLIVGYKTAKKTLPGFNILEKHPFPNVHWTYDRTERRYDYEADITYFLKGLIDKELDKLHYDFISVAKITRASFTRLLMRMGHGSPVVFVTSKTIYLIIDKESDPYHIIAFSREEIDYCDYPPQRLNRIIQATGAEWLPERTMYEVEAVFKQDIPERYIPYFWLLIKQE